MGKQRFRFGGGGRLIEVSWCAERATGVICYSPMQSGILTESFTPVARTLRTAGIDLRGVTQIST